MEKGIIDISNKRTEGESCMKKNKIFKRTAVMLFIAALAMSSASVAYAGQWKSDANGYWWDDNGSYPKNEWKWLDGNGDGVSESYYFGPDGYLLTNTTTPDGYTVNADGQWVENGVVKTQGTQKSSGGNNSSSTPTKKINTSNLVSYMNNVDKIENTSKVNPVGTGVVFPTEEVQVGEDLYWNNLSGGTDYTLHYYGPRGDYEAAGYTRKMYPNAKDYFTYDAWTTPSGITVDYLNRVLDENGKIKTATAEELGLTYEGGKVRDVPYDANVPLKRVVDLYALNIEELTPDNWISKSHHGLRGHNSFILAPEQIYIISKLSGQPNNFHDINWYPQKERTEYDAICDVLRNWLNSFDFEHASEMDRAKKVRELLLKAEYDSEAAARRDSQLGEAIYNVLIKKKGVCQDFAEAAHMLCSLVGLKCDLLGSSQADHIMYVVQVDGVPYGGDNGGLNLDQDWREQSKLGTRQSYNFYFGEYITYQ